MNTLPHYIGITGIMNAEESNRTASQFEQHGFKPNAGHIGMLGYCVCGDKEQDPKFKNRQLAPEELLGVMEDTHNRVLPMVHYEIGDGAHFADHLLTKLQPVLDTGVCKAIQLNGITTRKEIEEIKIAYPHVGIVLQLVEKIIAEGDDAVADYVKSLRERADMILIDPSMGRGLRLKTSEAIDMYHIIRKEAPKMNIGFAGGFTPETIQNRTNDFKKRTGRLAWSTDVESGVRTNDQLDSKKTSRHISQSRLGLDH